MTEKTTNPLARILQGAAAGALAWGIVAAFEILRRLGSEIPVLEPGRDLGLAALQGAALGALLGLFAAVPFLRWLSPAGIAFGVALGLGHWLTAIARFTYLPGVTDLATGAALWVGGGALLGQLLGFGLGRLGHVAPLPWRDGLAVAVFALFAFAPRPSFGDRDDRPNVLLLTIDTLRADRLGITGCPRLLSPELDRLARRGVTYERVVAPLPRTIPSLSSLMTGTAPHSHGVRDNLHYVLPSSRSTLAEELAERGWVTSAVNESPVLPHERGLYQGFRSANDRGRDWCRLGLLRDQGRILQLLQFRREDRSLVIAKTALTWLQGRPKHRPYFLWVHWVAPHIPYQPVFPYTDRLHGPYEGEFDHGIDYDRIKKAEMTYRNPLSEHEFRWALDLYDGEVAAADRAVGHLLRTMEGNGDLDNTLVLFTADHGESLGEHGYTFEHGDLVYGPAMNVPLVWVDPEHSMAPIEGASGTLLDWFPRILAAATGIEPDAEELEGSLRDDPRRPVFGESGLCRFPEVSDRLGWKLPKEALGGDVTGAEWKRDWEQLAIRAKQRFIEVDGWKLVYTPAEGGDRLELFDLRTDPGETRNVEAEFPDKRDELGEKLALWIVEGVAKGGEGEIHEVDAATKAGLEAFGYLGD